MLAQFFQKLIKLAHRFTKIFKLHHLKLLINGIVLFLDVFFIEIFLVNAVIFKNKFNFHEFCQYLLDLIVLLNNCLKILLYVHDLVIFANVCPIWPCFDVLSDFELLSETHRHSLTQSLPLILIEQFLLLSYLFLFL